MRERNEKRKQRTRASHTYRIITARDEIEVAVNEEHGGCVRAGWARIQYQEEWSVYLSWI